MPNAVTTTADLVTTQTAGRPGATVRLILSGVVDERRARTVHRSVIDALRRHRPTRIDIDLCGSTVVDAAGVRGLELCRADAAQLGCEVVLLRASVLIQPVLLAAGLV